MTEHEALLQIAAIANEALNPVAPAPLPTPIPPTPTPIPPTPIPPNTGPIQPSSTLNYTGPDRYVVYPRRLQTGDLQDGQSVSGGFTIPPGVVKMCELPLSHSGYLHLYVNGVEYTGPFEGTPGHYCTVLRAQGRSDSGSLDYNFY